MAVLHLNKESFDKLTTQKEHPVLIDFWAEWCGPCKMLGPELEALAEKYPELIIGKVNVDDNIDLAVQLQVDSIPALFYYRDGKLQKNFVGYMDKDTLAEKLGL